MPAAPNPDHLPPEERPATAVETPRTAWGNIWGLLRGRCPRCLTGRMFRGPFAMNDPCPTCGLLFQREEGYFLGAMYFSYALGSFLLFPAFYVATHFLPSWDGTWVAVLVWVLYLPFVPMVFRYSRAIWIYLDRWGRFDDSTAGAYEKVRLRQIAEAKAGRGEADRK